MAKDFGWCKPSSRRRLRQVRTPTSVLRLPPQMPGQGGAPTLDAACPGPLFLIREHLNDDNISCVDGIMPTQREGSAKIPPKENGSLGAFRSQRLRTGLTSVTPTAFAITKPLPA